MPELPEIAAHAERLDRQWAGRELTAFEPLSFTALKTFDPSPETAVGATLTAVRQRGKLLLLEFGDLAFVIHLMQGGRLRPDAKPTRRPRGGLVRWRFTEGALLLTEAGTERKAGVWVVRGDPAGQPPLRELGPDATEVDAAALASLLHAHPMRLHTFLRDQTLLAGLGRRLANEICHRARLSPFANTRRLGADGAESVVDAIREAVAESLRAERERDEMSSSPDRPARVHNRAGEPCVSCGDVVRAIEYRDYTISYCPACQTNGRLLADNRLSKLGIRDEAHVGRRLRR